MIEANILFCTCGRSFTHKHAYSNHQHQCKKTEKRLSGALEKAKEIWNAKKCRCTIGPSCSVDDQTIEVTSLDTQANVSFIPTIQDI